MSTQNKPELLVRADRPIGVEEVAALVLQHYGVHAAVERLTGERDLNFRVTPRGLAGGDTALLAQQFVLKISHSAEEPALTDYQTQALLYLAEHAPTLPVQRIQRTCSGTYASFVDASNAPRCMRLLSYLPGVPLHAAQRSARQCAQLGALLAQLDQALSGFSHPEQHHVLLWDVKQAGQLQDWVSAVQDPTLRALCQYRLAHFAAEIQPQLAQLRSQNIHNDFNPHNLLVAADQQDMPVGILDFGDMVYSPLVCDVAVGASYYTDVQTGDVSGLLAFIEGYHWVSRLTEQEIDVLPHLIAVRCAMTLAITDWRAARDPDNRSYILRNHALASAGLRALQDSEPFLRELKQCLV